MAQDWKTDLLKEINIYFINNDETKVKTALKKGYMAPDGHGKYKLTMSGEKFVEDVRSYLRKEKEKQKKNQASDSCKLSN